MTVDWGIAKFKSKIIDNARYLFTNYIDTSKGLDALYNRPEVSSEKAVCYKNYNMVRLTSNTPGIHITAWKIDDASKINKLYVRGKVNVTTKYDGAIVITNSTLTSRIYLIISPSQNNTDFKIIFRENDLLSTIYTESVDLSFGEFYDIEGMIDFQHNTISAARDNVEKPVLTTKTFPSFDVIYVGFYAGYTQDIPNLLGKDVFITWE